MCDINIDINFNFTLNTGQVGIMRILVGYYIPSQLSNQDKYLVGG